MDNQNIQSFTKKMLSEEVLSCTLCKNLLTIPIMIVENIGNVCAPCFKSGTGQNEWNAIPNSKLDIVLKNLQLPCKFESEGCNTITSYDNLKQHEEECIFRSINCILPKEDCGWKGRLVDLLNHFKEEHPKHVLTSLYEEFSFDLNIKKIGNVTKLIINKNKLYILRIKELSEESSLVHYVQVLKSTNDDLEAFIKYVGENGQHKHQIRSLPFSGDRNEQNCKKIKLSTLQDIADSQHNVKVVLKPKKCEVKNVTSELLKILECPICKELMKPPIRQCLSGHSLCDVCRKKLTECPTCRSNWGDSKVRNFALESLTPSLQYPCTYTQYGCAGVFLGSEINKHEGICEYKVFSCPASGCHFTGNYVSCKNHFKLNHGGSLVEGTVHLGSFTPLASKAATTVYVTYFFEHKNIYELTFTRLADSCAWSVRILNTCDHSVKYFYTISVYDSHVHQKKVTKTNACLEKDTALTNKTIVVFPYDNLVTYKNTSNNDVIKYCCEIFIKHSDN